MFVPRLTISMGYQVDRNMSDYIVHRQDKEFLAKPA